MDYTTAIQKINEILKGNRAAISEICRNAGQRGRSAYYNALRKTDWDQLSPDQRDVVDEALKYIEKVKDGNPDPTAIKAAEILN